MDASSDGAAVPRFGVVTHAVGHAAMPFAECLRRIAAAGGKHIMLLVSPDGPVIRPGAANAVLQYPNVLDSDPAELRRVVEAEGLRVSCLLAPGPIAVEEDAAAAASLERAIPYAARAAELGCDSLCVSAPRPVAPGSPAQEREERLRRLAGVMEALARAVSAPITVAIDVHFNSLVETVEDCRVLLRAASEPRAGLILNIGHLTTARQEGWRLLAEHPRRIHVIGWKDHSLAVGRSSPVLSVELGTGDSPFQRYVQGVKRAGVAAVHLVNVEHAPVGEEVAVLRRSIAYIESLWARVS